MRILVLAPQAFYSPQGTPLSVYHRVKALGEFGHDVHILTYPVGSVPPDIDVRVFRSRGLHFTRRIEPGPSYRKIWFDLIIFINLLHLLRRNRYDVVVGHEEGGFIAVLAAYFFRLPVVYEMHSSLPLQVIEWEFSQSRLVVWLFRLAERLTLRRCNAVIAISPELSTIAHAIAPNTHIVTIQNVFEILGSASTADLAKLRLELGITDNHRVVLYTGSFVTVQALDLLLLSVPQVVRHVPDSCFVLVGGRQQEITRLSRLVDRLNIASNVRLVLQRPYREMPSFEALSEVVVSPRIRGINPPGKLAAYVKSGRPIVATNCPVHKQLFHSPAAILTQPDPDSLAQGIIAALTRNGSTRHACRPTRKETCVSREDRQIQSTYEMLLRSVVSSGGALLCPSTMQEGASEKPAHLTVTGNRASRVGPRADA